MILTSPGLPLIIVVGLRSEARHVAREGVRVLVGGGAPGSLAGRLDKALQQGARGVLSFGICGALIPGLRPGDLVIGESVAAFDKVFLCDPAWTAHLAARLPQARRLPLTARNSATTRVAAKRDLARATGAAVVDMESHVVASHAAEQGVPFAVVRAVSDTASQAVPQAAIAGMRPDGSTDAWAVLRGLARSPLEIPSLIRVAFGAGAAMRVLGETARRLGPELAPPQT